MVLGGWGVVVLGVVVLGGCESGGSGVLGSWCWEEFGSGGSGGAVRVWEW